VQERVECPHTCFPVFLGIEGLEGLQPPVTQQSQIFEQGLNYTPRSDWLNQAIRIDYPCRALILPRFNAPDPHPALRGVDQATI